MDAFLDGSIQPEKPDAAIQASLLMILLAAISVPAIRELSALIKKTSAKVFMPPALTTVLLLASSFYWAQFFETPPAFLAVYVPLVLAFGFLALFLYQGVRFGNEAVIANCGANALTILYLGLLASFFPAIRITFGIWAFLMFICVVKASDIGAYTFGRIFGKHKFAPRISPKKTWEGLGGAAFAAVLVASIFSMACGIMCLWKAIAFGAMFAFLGQLGDLAESMIKRDAEQKDSANSVPGFGGVLDIIDSPIVTAAFAYGFFGIMIGR